MRSLLMPCCFSFLLHSSLLLTGFTYAPVRYQVAGASQSVELSLVAGGRGAQTEKHIAERISAPQPVPAPQPDPQPQAQPVSAAVEQTRPSQITESAGSQGQDAWNQAASVGSSGAGAGNAGNKPPRYPKAARKLGYEGVVTLSVAVDAQGRAKDVQVENSSGYAMLDEAALKAIRQWCFEPARRFGVAVEGNVIVPVVFDLQGSERE